MSKTTYPIARSVVAFAAALALPVSAAHAASPAAKPVMIGLDGADYDACGSQGQVRGLREDGDNFLAVRTAPSATASEADRLSNGATVILCDSTKDGKWAGVVYPAQGQTVADCATSSPVARTTAYGGPCRSGWVASTFVTVMAG